MPAQSWLLIVLSVVIVLSPEVGALQIATNCPTVPQISRVSVSSGGIQGNARSTWASLSANGRYVEFESLASNLTAGDSNNLRDVFVHDRGTGQTRRASTGMGGKDGNAHSFAQHISGDGRYVAFESWASNLVPGDTGNIWDVFVHDRQTGQTSRVSVASNGVQGNGSSTSPQVSGDGRYVVFDSLASNLVAGDTNGAADVFLHDRITSQTSVISATGGGAPGNGDSIHPTLSADGRFVAFISFASNLLPGDSDALADLFLVDRQMGTMTRVVMASTGAAAGRTPGYPSLSNDGRYLAFETEASFTAGDANGATDVYVFDQQTGQTILASMGTNGEVGNGVSTHPRLSADGQLVIFQSRASNLVAGDMNGAADIFVRNLAAGQTIRLTMNQGCVEANADSYAPDLSTDGRYAAFTSEATNLVPGDPGLCEGERCADVFVAAVQFTPAIVDLPDVSPQRHFFTGDVILSWNSVTWATQYQIQIAGDKTFTSTLIAEPVVDRDTLTLNMGSFPPGTYYWRVRVQKATGQWSAWSAIDSFSVGAG